MAYVRNEWKKNDIITTEKLNNLEEGCDDIFDLGVVDITFPTEENPSVSIEENLTEEQVKKLWNAKRVKFSVVSKSSKETYFLNLCFESDVSDLFGVSNSNQVKNSLYYFLNLIENNIFYIQALFLLNSSSEEDIQSNYVLTMSEKVFLT